MDNTAYYVAGIDVHKRMLAVVVANARDRELQFEGRRFGTTNIYRRPRERCTAGCDLESR